MADFFVVVRRIVGSREGLPSTRSSKPPYKRPRADRTVARRISHPESFRCPRRVIGFIWNCNRAIRSKTMSSGRPPCCSSCGNEHGGHIDPPCPPPETPSTVDGARLIYRFESAPAAAVRLFRRLGSSWERSSCSRPLRCDPGVNHTTVRARPPFRPRFPLIIFIGPPPPRPPPPLPRPPFLCWEKKELQHPFLVPASSPFLPPRMDSPDFKGAIFSLAPQPPRAGNGPAFRAFSAGNNVARMFQRGAPPGTTPKTSRPCCDPHDRGGTPTGWARVPRPKPHGPQHRDPLQHGRA